MRFAFFLRRGSNGGPVDCLSSYLVERVPPEESHSRDCCEKMYFHTLTFSDDYD